MKQFCISVQCGLFNVIDSAQGLILPFDRKGTGSQSPQSRSFISEASRASQELTDISFLQHFFHIFCKIAVDMEPILECRTPPPSPEPSRLVTKRRCSFGESPQQPKVAAREGAVAPALDANFMEEHTTVDCAFTLLMNNQKNQQKDSTVPLLDQMAAIPFSVCWVCCQQSEIMPCAFCERSVCEMCVRQCDRCVDVFCSFCSTINYDNHEDRPLCLTCHNEELRLRRLKADNARTLSAASFGTGNGLRQLTA